MNASVYLLLAGKGCHDEDRTKHTWTTYGDTVTKETTMTLKGKETHSSSSKSLLPPHHKL